MILAIATAFVVGTIATGALVDAAKPQPDPDGDLTMEGIVFEIVGLLKHPVFGLEEIKDEVRNIETSHTDISAIKTQTDKIQMVKDNQYVPFTALTATDATCDVIDANSTTMIFQVRISSSATTGNFIITGVFMDANGLNGVADTDFIKLRALSVDGATVGFTVSDNLVGNTNGSSAFDIMGQPLRDGGTFPHQITVVNAGQVHDVLIEFTCNAGTTGSDIGFFANEIKVSGWKLASDTITVDTLSVP